MTQLDEVEARLFNLVAWRKNNFNFKYMITYN